METSKMRRGPDAAASGGSPSVGAFKLARSVDPESAQGVLTLTLDRVARQAGRSHRVKAPHPVRSVAARLLAARVPGCSCRTTKARDDTVGGEALTTTANLKMAAASAASRAPWSSRRLMTDRYFSAVVVAAMLIGCRSIEEVAEADPNVAPASSTYTAVEAPGWRFYSALKGAPVCRPFVINLRTPDKAMPHDVCLRLVRKHDATPVAEWAGPASEVAMLCAPDFDEYVLRIAGAASVNMLEVDIASANAADAIRRAGGRYNRWPGGMEVGLLGPSRVRIQGAMTPKVTLSFLAKDARRTELDLPLTGDGFDQPYCLLTSSASPSRAPMNGPLIGIDRPDVNGRLWLRVFWEPNFDTLANLGVPGLPLNVRDADTGVPVVGAAVNWTSEGRRLETVTDERGNFRVLETAAMDPRPVEKNRWTVWLDVSAPGYVTNRYVFGPKRMLLPKSDADEGAVESDLPPTSISLRRAR